MMVYATLETGGFVRMATRLIGQKSWKNNTSFALATKRTNRSTLRAAYTDTAIDTNMDQEKVCAHNLKSVYEKVNTAKLRAQENSTTGNKEKNVTLVAVSKTKPVSMLQECYDAGHRVFGENYVNEIVEKSPLLPSDIKWHFIGHLQSNKAKQLVTGVSNLYVVETVDTAKIATFLDRACESADRQQKLKVLIQVNTSGEESKHGVEPNETSLLPLARHILESCPQLDLSGVMTIGMPDYTSTPENFKCLIRCRSILAEEIGVDEDSLTLSMGMSSDYESAIEMGSTNVRVGSAIFGARVYKK